jgi:hypothetical protein
MGRVYRVPYIEPSDVEIAYVAGFFDGEGCVYLNTRKNGRAILRIKVSQKDRRPLDLLQERFGGSVCVSRNRKTGNECWSWSLSTAQAERFVRMVQPFCLVKAEAIAIALEYCAIKCKPAGPGIGPRWIPFTDDEREKHVELRQRLHAVNSWRDRPLSKEA